MNEGFAVTSTGSTAQRQNRGLGVRLAWVLVVAMGWGMLGACQRAEETVGPTPEALAAREAAEARRVAEKREQEREANRQRIMEELRQKDEDEARKRERRETAKKAGEEKETREIVFGDKEWEDKMVARVKTIGTSLGTVETRDGRRFEGVMVKSARGDGLTLYHQGGQVTLAYGDLSEALQATFRYDAREAAAVAAGQALPELSPADYKAVQERIARDRAAEEARQEAERQVVQERETEGAIDGDTDTADPELGGVEEISLVSKRREVAQELNRQMQRLTQMRDAGFKASSAEVRKQKALVAELQQRLKAADAVVMAERERLKREAARPR